MSLKWDSTQLPNLIRIFPRFSAKPTYVFFPVRVFPRNLPKLSKTHQFSHPRCPRNFPGLEVTTTPMTPRMSWASFAPGSSTIAGSSARPWSSQRSSGRTGRFHRGSRAPWESALLCRGDRSTGPMGDLELLGAGHV